MLSNIKPEVRLKSIFVHHLSLLKTQMFRNGQVFFGLPKEYKVTKHQFSSTYGLICFQSKLMGWGENLGFEVGWEI